jgi:hypothetical protein
MNMPSEGRGPAALTSIATSGDNSGCLHINGK